MMVDTSALRGVPASSPAAPGAAAEDGAAAGSGFAALLAGLPAAGPPGRQPAALPGEPPGDASATPEVAAAAQGAEIGDELPVEGEPPPLLGWLFGLMMGKQPGAVDVAPQAGDTELELPVPTSTALVRTATAAAAIATGADPHAAQRAAAVTDAAAAEPMLPASMETADVAEMLASESTEEGLPQAALGTRAAPIESPPAAAPARAVAAERSLIATSPDFAAEFGERISWQIEEGISEAQIELHPAELGRLVVNIEMRGDEAHVRIVASEGATRALLAQALPQLRELLGGAGLNLTRAQISDSGSRRDERGHGRDGLDHEQPGQRRRVSRILLVDAYA